MESRTIHQGELFVFSATVLQSLFPLVVHAGVQFFQPLFFAAITTLGAAVIFACILFVLRRPFFRCTVTEWPLVLGVVIFVIVLPSICIFIGASSTGGIDISLLGQSELVFSLILFRFLLGERIRRWQLGGALLVLIGTIVVLYRSGTGFNSGAFLIVLSGLFYPFGNACAKHLLQTMDSIQLLFFRTFLGGILLLLLSLIIEKPVEFQVPPQAFVFLIIQLLGVNVITKILWYEGVRRLDITKCVAIISASPAFSLLFAIVFFHEQPTNIQLLGFMLTMGGIILLMLHSNPSLIEADLA